MVKELISRFPSIEKPTIKVDEVLREMPENFYNGQPPKENTSMASWPSGYFLVEPHDGKAVGRYSWRLFRCTYTARGLPP